MARSQSLKIASKYAKTHKKDYHRDTETQSGKGTDQFEPVREKLRTLARRVGDRL